MGDAEIAAEPAKPGPLALYDAVWAAFFAPGRLAASIAFDDPRSRSQAGTIALGSIVIMLAATAAVGPPSQVLGLAAIMLLMCVNGVFYYPFMRPLSWRRLTLRHFAQVYAHVLPFGVVQMFVYFGVSQGQIFVLFGFLVGLWEALALAILLRRTLAFAYWKSFIGVAIGTAVHWFVAIVSIFTFSGFHF